MRSNRRVATGRPSRVLAGEESIHIVTKVDGDWLFLDTKDLDEDTTVGITLGDMVMRFPELQGLPQLKDGYAAERVAESGTWTVGRALFLKE